MGYYVEFYCKNENRELKKMVDPILRRKFSWISQKDYDDFYSIASMVVWDCEKKFDLKKVKTKKFKSFVSSCVHNKIKTHVTHMNRKKRVVRDKDGNILHDIPIDTPINSESDITIGETLAHKTTTESAYFDNKDEVYSEKMEKYLSRLSDLQKEVLRLTSIGFMPNEILKELHINQKTYEDCYAAIHSYRNISILL